jgi:hypothetical protein
VDAGDEPFVWAQGRLEAIRPRPNSRLHTSQPHERLRRNYPQAITGPGGRGTGGK